MLKGHDIICISSIDWDFVWQGHQEIMSTFAKNGNRVLFIENTGVRTPTIKDLPRLKRRISNWARSTKGFREEEKNIFIYSPLVLPFPYSKIARWINKKLFLSPVKKWMRAMGFRDIIVWTFLPTGTALDIINEIDKKLLVYYYIADFEELTDKPKRIKKTEKLLVAKCDLVFAQNHILAEKYMSLNSNIEIFPFGVNTGIFEDFLASTAKKIPPEFNSVKHPVIGYIGGIHKHIDLPLIERIAKERPGWSIVLVGPKQTDVSQFDGMPNVIFLGQKDFKELPAYINQFDVGIIPYISSEYTNTVYPTKLNEYHIMGKPVVSTKLPEVEKFNDLNNGIVNISNTHEDFIKLIEKAMVTDNDDLRAARIRSAKKNSWEDRIEGMSVLMEKAIEEKSRLPMDWRKQFLLLYKKTKKNALKTLAVIGALWLFVFYTPIIWFLAEPLKISEVPEKADAVIVFGGGVGESGKAGQGYEERVGYAIDLYKKGYAKKLIFSSGYRYVFDETLVMKALAVALGVGEEAIIIEGKARNTYENALFTKEIMDKLKWNKALLVSSPYHMRRVSLVFGKMDGDVKIIYTPILKSSFYSHASRGIFAMKISLGQIRGLVHEVLGIVYYYFKGYI